MQEIKTTSTLYIPDNIKTGFEFVGGFGWKEMARAAAITGIAAIFALIYNAITRPEHGFFVVAGVIFVVAAGCVTALRKDATNQSAIDHGRRFIRFSKEQQKFKYKYHNPFEGGS